ncbi:FAD-dependent oxidoreductase [Actinokineospora sp.]|uniref:FAD-dependent oxidoreductase n=1 Tax=Actinokineospora sp. TaxID=1872133 RepID=UPI00403774A4
MESLPVIVIGAGPVGLAAAAQLAERGLPFQVFEAGDGPGHSVGQWAHVRLFSPWRYNVDATARRLLVARGWQAPDDDALPTGAALVADYLRPLAACPSISPHIHYGSPVTAVARLGVDRVRSAGRSAAPFVVRLADGAEWLGRAVIDASGTWTVPNPLGATGLPAHGEAAAASWIEHALPDVLGADRDRFADRHTIVVGSGHSAATTVLALAELAAAAPDTQVTWAIRGTTDRAYGGGADDALPARGAIGAGLHLLVDRGAIDLVTDFAVTELRAVADPEPDEEPVELVGRGSDGDHFVIPADRIVRATGYRPDLGFLSELRLDNDPILQAPRVLAPLIDPNHHACGTVRPHGHAELSHPEPDFFAVGIKSYGRAPTFLLATGYEQVRSVVAALAGDWDAARRVELDLPETGVCTATLGAKVLADELGVDPDLPARLTEATQRQLLTTPDLTEAVLAAARELGLPPDIAQRAAGFARAQFGAATDSCC